MPKAVIFGAGKIARGFIGQLLFDAGISFAFVEKNAELVRLLNGRGGYQVNVLGAPEKSERITGYAAICTDDPDAVAAAAQDTEIIFTAVGGKNLDALAPIIAHALRAAPRALNVITCENWKHPAAQLAREVKRIAPDLKAGFAEAVVMRSAIEPNAEQLALDPLAVNVQDYWNLPVDAGALIAPLINVPGLTLVNDFAGFLERKFYTYNAANGTVSYLGALLGHTVLADAAWDARIEPALEQVYDETGRALSQKYGIPLEEQRAFANTSRAKLRDRIIADNIERNARDPMRKLGPDDRLVGSARLVEQYGIVPEGLATAIAAALYYENPDDPSAVELQRIRSEVGSEGALERICKIQPGERLYRLVLEKQAMLEEKEWIR